MVKIGPEFGWRLREARLKAGMSQKDLAARTGINPTYLVELEKGRKNPLLCTAIKLSRALGVTLESLCPEEQEPLTGTYPVA